MIRRASIWAGLGWAGLGLVGLAGCGREEGIVEVYWQIENANLERIYPQGSRVDTCDFESQSGVGFDLQVQLTIAENSSVCGLDWSDPSCVIVEQLRFECTRARGTANAVPISAQGADDPGYLMFVEVLLVPADGEAFVPASSCVQGPGPRVRRVLPGRITDLEVYEFVFRALDPKLQGKVDLDACREASGTDTMGTDGTGTDSDSDSGSDSGSGSDSTGP